MAATDSLCRSFLDLWWHFDPAAATAGRLGDFSPDAIQQYVAALRSVAGAVEGLDLEDLGDEIDRTALLDHLRVLLFRLEHEHPYRTDPWLWAEHLATAFAGPLARAPDDPVAAAAALERLRALPGYVRRAEDSIRRPAPVLVDAALEQLAQVGELIEQTIDRFEPVWTAAEADSARIGTEARTALAELIAALRSRIAPDSDSHSGAIGEAEVDRRLHYEHASIHNGGEVWRGALRLAEEVEAAVGSLAAAVDPSRPWRELYRSFLDQPRPSDPIPRFAEAIGEARRFVAAHGIRGAAPPLALAIEPLSASDRILEGLVVYHALDEAPAALHLGDVPVTAMAWLAARIVDPGLHLMESRTAELPGLVRRHIAASSTPSGWALYAQELMAELGFEPAPEARFAERVLFLREVHLAVVDLGLHTKQLTAAEAIRHLTERVPSERQTALADVRRLLVRPLSACAAILGWQEIRRLRREYEAARGSPFSLAGFHEELLSYGGLPVPLIRWGMGIDA